MFFRTGCNNASVYGSNCDTPCPKNCKDNTCNIQNGACFRCTPGWSGVKCDTSKMPNKVLNQFKYSCFAVGYCFNYIKTR